MNKEVLLVLEVSEGRDWKPLEGYKTVIEAHFQNKTLNTDTVPLITNPKFNTQLTWEADYKTIRSYRLRRVPIKLECYAVNEKSNRTLLGYIILPLSLAAVGVQADSKWHKLLGGRSAAHKFSPCILLSLHLEEMTLDQRSQYNGRHVTALQNGQLQNDDDRMSGLQTKRGLLLHNRNGLEIRQVHVNGNEGPMREDRSAAISHSLDQRGATNGIHVDDEEEEEQMDYDDDDIYNFDSEEEFTDDDANDGQGMIADVYSLVDSKPSSAKNDSDPLSFPVQKNQPQVATTHEGDLCVAVVNVANVNQRVNPDAPDAKGSNVAENISEHESLLRSRADAREQLRKLSQSSLKASSQQRLPSQPSKVVNSPLEKRLLDTSGILSNDLDRNKKSVTAATVNMHRTSESVGKTYEFAGSPPDNQSRQLAESGTDHQTLLKSQLSQDPDATSVAYLLSQSVKKNSRPGTSGISPSKPLTNTSQVLVPRLNEEEGYFSIAPRYGEVEEEFVFSVTIIYAKNLSKIIPKEVTPLLKEGFQFHYYLMGCSIFTDPFKDVDNPTFLAEKASAVIRSSHQTLSTYFTQHYSLPVYFMNKDVKLGVCVIDILQLADIANSCAARIEDVYEMNSVNKGQFKDVDKSDSRKSVIALSFEVLKRSAVDPTHASFKDKVDSGQFPEFHSKTMLGGSLNEIEVSDSMSSGSDGEQSEYKRTMKQPRKGKLCYGCKSGLVKGGGLHLRMVEEELEGQREVMKMEAVQELDKWKRQKKRQFLKELATSEETMQRLLATEWSSKTKIIEAELSHRLSECNKLQEQLNSALSQLAVREEKLITREKKILNREQDMTEKLKTDLATKPKGSQPSSSSYQHTVLKQLATEKSKNTQLQTESTRLKEDVQSLEKTVQANTQEIISLRKKLIQTDDIIGITKETEMMQAKIDNLSERKQYYKTQWVNALTDLHKLHSAHKYAIDEISNGREFRTPADFSHKRIRRADVELPSSSISGYKLKKLTEERKTLLGSGIYSQSHSIIKQIDKKIQELIE